MLHMSLLLTAEVINAESKQQFNLFFYDQQNKHSGMSTKIKSNICKIFEAGWSDLSLFVSTFPLSCTVFVKCQKV